MTPQNGAFWAILGHFEGFFANFSKSGPTIFFKIAVIIDLGNTYMLRYMVSTRNGSMIDVWALKGVKMGHFHVFLVNFDPPPSHTRSKNTVFEKKMHRGSPILEV